MYEQGYLRTSSDHYNMSTFANYIHLTNNCLQKYGENYGSFEDGNTLSFKVDLFCFKHFLRIFNCIWMKCIRTLR